MCSRMCKLEESSLPKYTLKRRRAVENNAIGLHAPNAVGQLLTNQRATIQNSGNRARMYVNRSGDLVTCAIDGYRFIICPGGSHNLSSNPLECCKGLIDNGQFSISVVVSHMACEIATERSLSESFANKGIQYLEEPVGDFLNGYNLAMNESGSFTLP